MSWTRDLTKGQKNELRRLIGLAHDRELSAALGALEEQFRRWRSGELGPHELNKTIHAFHQGPSRQLGARYNLDYDDAPFMIAMALRNGILVEHEVATDLLEVMRANRALDV